MFCSMNNNLLKIGNNKYISHLFCNYCYKDMLDIYFARKKLNLSIKQQTCQNRKVEQFVRSEDTDKTYLKRIFYVMRFIFNNIIIPV